MTKNTVILETAAFSYKATGVRLLDDGCQMGALTEGRKDGSVSQQAAPSGSSMMAKRSNGKMLGR